MVTKIFNTQRQQVYIVEWCPETTQEEKQLQEAINMRRDEAPTLEGIRQLCHEVGVRARYCKGQQYLGHIYEDGSCDNAVLSG